MKFKTIEQQIQDIVDEICSNYCKYTEMEKDGIIDPEKMYIEKCSKCPFI